MPNLRLNPDRFKGLSFRIGRATNLARLGMTKPSTIVDRWRNNACQKFIRCSDFVAPILYIGVTAPAPAAGMGAGEFPFLLELGRCFLSGV